MKFSKEGYLLLKYPRAYLLLSYLHLIAKEKGGVNVLRFKIEDIKKPGIKVLLCKRQIRNALVHLENLDFILISKDFWGRGYRLIFLCNGGE